MESNIRYMRKHEKRVSFTQDVVLIQVYLYYSTSPYSSESLVSKILYKRSQILGNPTGNIEKYRESLVIPSKAIERDHTLSNSKEKSLLISEPCLSFVASLTKGV
jgi:hypothetical protein